MEFSLAARKRLRALFSAVLLLFGASIPPVLEKADRWEVHFQGDPDFNFLIDSVTTGFSYPSVPNLNPEKYEVPNYVDEIHWEKATTAVERELTLGRVIRTSWDHVSGTAAIGIVDKQRSGFVKHRLIHDLSRPKDLSTNSRATVEKRTFASVRDAMDVIRPGTFMAKIDVSEFYRNCPMAFHHWPDLGFQWNVFGEDEPAVFCDTRMPFRFV